MKIVDTNGCTLFLKEFGSAAGTANYTTRLLGSLSGVRMGDAGTPTSPRVEMFAGASAHAYRFIANWNISGVEFQESAGTGGTGGFVTRFALPDGGSFLIGNGAISTSATRGFLYIPTCAGAPTGTPTTYVGSIALVYDTTNNQLCAFNGGWKKVALS